MSVKTCDILPIAKIGQKYRYVSDILISYYCTVVLNSAPQYRHLLLPVPCRSPQDTQTRPFTGSFGVFGLIKIHSSRSSISNSAEHSGQVVLPGLASTLWFKQNGHFRTLSIVSFFSHTDIEPSANSFDFSGLVCSVNYVCYFPLIKAGFCHYGGCINSLFSSLIDKLHYLVCCV